MTSPEPRRLVPKAATRPATPAGSAPGPRRRLTAEARKSSILAAARRAFTETGDMNGTTIKVIAEHSGISEGGVYRHFDSKDQVLPLLGLVLFGDPQVARRFYRENFAVAMDRLAEAWREVEDRYGFPFESPDISARAVMGMALILALESHHARTYDRDRALALISAGTVKGFFPAIEPARRRR